ncbi:MAG: sodium-translocating pyrophosphatase [SAR202 cluster bacterium]|nr:sodium-translocating pyrophosphatase [SAR202 cluster bacterium]
MELVWVVPIAGIAALAFAAWLAYDVLKMDRGNVAMQDIASRIVQGAMAFLNRQYRTIAILSVVAAVIIGGLLYWLGHTDVDSNGVIDSADKIGLAWRTAVAFLLGAFCSALSGFIGMYIAVRANLRTAAAAAAGSFKGAVNASLRGGAVSGFLIVALSLIGVAVIFYAYGGGDVTKMEVVPFLIVGYGFGASFVALFAQLGGGIYTKAADMGADLVGKVESGIPEDDPRNPAVIADLVGDNVGDCAGRGADLFESTAAENIGAMILGVAAFVAARNAGLPHPEVWVLLPLVIRSFGIFATIIGLLTVKADEKKDPMAALNNGFYVSVVLSVIGLGTATYFMLGDLVQNTWWIFGAGLVGIITSLLFVNVTQYYTDTKYNPVKSIGEASRTGPATNVVAGIATGLETTASAALIIGGALLVSFWLGDQVKLPDGTPLPHGGLIGTAVATMGMLMTAAYVLAMDTFGPITDNGAGIIEMSGGGEEARAIADRLDAVGNTTKAVTKGYAIGSAGLAAFLLFSAYLDEVANLLTDKLGVPTAFRVVDLAKPEVFVSAMLGVMLVFLFSALTMRAVGRTAGAIIEEVRRQFRENPNIMAGTENPDYARCVDITTKAGLREMVLPGILAVAAPIVVGVVMKWQYGGSNGAEAVAGFLMVGTIGGIMMATFFNNAGGSWDNAKKLIESGGLIDHATGKPLKKGTMAHGAAVVGDTVGDPFKDTTGPSLHVLIKLLATVTLVMAPLFI